MKATSRFIGYAALLSGVLLAAQLQAIDAGPSLWLDRYTLETNGTLVHDSGNLLANGRFRVLFSEIVDPFYIDPTIDFTPISGRPVILEELYSGYKSAGVVPHWTRSRDDFYVGGYLPYVIVSIAGGQDPNPTITITQQPQSESVLAGNFAYLYVFADPIAYLSYQWCKSGKPIPGATDFFLWIDNVQPAQAGIYSILLNTGGKSVSSAKVLLRVALPVAITTQPRSQTVKAGHGAVFRVAVSGTGPFSYQWYRNGNLIPKATGPSYVIPAVKTTDAGNYAVFIGNGLSYALSTAAALVVTH